MNTHPLFTGPVGEVRLEYVLRREREGDYLAKLVNTTAGTWTTGLGGSALQAVAHALTQPLRRGRIGEEPTEPTADGPGPDATEGVPA
jgi:hypothetical protein